MLRARPQKAKAHVVVAVARLVPVAYGRAAVLSVVVPTAPAYNTVIAFMTFNLCLCITPINGNLKQVYISALIDAQLRTQT